MVAIKIANDVTELALCHSWLFTWTARSHDSVHKMKTTGIYTCSCEFQKTKTTYLSLQHVSLHAWSVLLGAVGPPNGETVRLALLFDLTGRLRCFHFQQASLLSDVPLRTSYLKTEQSHGRVCLILQQRRSRMCPLLDYFCRWCVNNKLNIERGNLKSLLITYWRYMLSLLWVQVDLMLVKYTS